MLYNRGEEVLGFGDSILAKFPSLPHCRNFRFDGYTTLGVGGGAPLALFPRCAEELSALVCFLQSERLPYRVVGNGSNILAADAGFRGAVVAASRMRGIRCQGELAEAECGVSVSALLRVCAEHGLGGIGFMAGIPAAVGGAVYMNAGAQGRCIAECIESVRIAEGGRVFELKAGECGFSYKHSAFMESGSCILSAKFRLQKGAVQSILSDIRAALRRREGLPRGKSCGCVFKNGSGYTAGELIERAGMKGAACGGAFVSGAHANFIINGGRASAADCLALIGRIRAAVAASSRILLQEEICYIGDFA